jgi:hypothetical protein
VAAELVVGLLIYGFAIPHHRLTALDYGVSNGTNTGPC